MMSTSRGPLLARAIGQSIAVTAAVAAVLFGGAGRLDWLPAWCISILLLCFFVIAGMWMFIKAPELLEERLTASRKSPRWDRIILTFYTIALFVLLLTAAFDAGRYGWSHVPFAIRVFGASVLLTATAVISWCVRVNSFLSSHARVQREREQFVIDAGPYHYVRHPMYCALIVLFIGLPLALASWLALVPAAAIAALFAVRTALEDRLLTSQLPGYGEYAARVRYRLLPGLW
jgi:protein-S-isoprenylcysteine O-methyltransferase Ste14